jgi:hypothetical protein
VRFLAQASLGADGETVADQKHADHQLRIDGGSSCRAVEASQMLTRRGAIDEAVGGAQEMIGRDMILKLQFVEQSLLHHQKRSTIMARSSPENASLGNRGPPSFTRSFQRNRREAEGELEAANRN